MVESHISEACVTTIISWLKAPIRRFPGYVKEGDNNVSHFNSKNGLDPKAQPPGDTT
jgi:hypothetical protein